MRNIFSGRLTIVAATASLATVPAVAVATPAAPVTAHAAKTCSSGYRHAVIDGRRSACARADTAPTRTTVARRTRRYGVCLRLRAHITAKTNGRLTAAPGELV
jgi:hypothetical protein